MKSYNSRTTPLVITASTGRPQAVGSLEQESKAELVTFSFSNVAPTDEVAIPGDKIIRDMQVTW